ncbi:dTDP-4-dehydrorhamnose reductase family protein [Streptomyces kebangsaanensis]|uniref:dTDP-4-dehydrorhamnose reductase family protein n=1 Tax=Streptomyces kebangsaanensis TaxID=864058 RepID=UPI00093C91FA|nr:SDR family oxidoreductase [Streptomyces kebangsaanensis]
MRAAVFGASGLLGRSVMRAFHDCEVTGTSLRRTGQGLVAVDATSADEIQRVLSRLRPDVVVNCVGERRPEVWATAPARAHELNVDAARLIAEGARHHGARLLHISSDYVFDGRNPAYRTDAPRNPVNVYGRWKLLAEDVVRSVCPDAAILRLPVLYGPAQYTAETNLTQIARLVSAGVDAELDDVCVRYPTHADEAAEVCRWIAAAQLRGQCLGSVCHWSAEQGFTKYRMAVLIARRFGLPTDHIRAGEADAASGDRPVDCRLDCQDLRAVLGWPAHRYRMFSDEFPQVVEPWLLSSRRVSG